MTFRIDYCEVDMQSYWLLLGHVVIQGLDVWHLKWQFRPELAKGRYVKPRRVLITKGVYLGLCTVLLLPPHPVQLVEVLLHGSMIAVFVSAPVTRFVLKQQSIRRSRRKKRR